MLRLAEDHRADAEASASLTVQSASDLHSRLRGLNLVRMRNLVPVSAA